MCTVCGRDDVPTRDRFAERLEYRRLDAREHLHYQTLRLICRACVLEIKATREAGGNYAPLPLFRFPE